MTRLAWQGAVLGLVSGLGTAFVLGMLGVWPWLAWGVGTVVGGTKWTLIDRWAARIRAEKAERLSAQSGEQPAAGG